MEKNRKTKNLLLIGLLIAVLTLSIAYAGLSVNLYVRSSAVVSGQNTNWKVEFNNATCTASGNATVTHGLDKSPNTVLSGLIATFKAPGDSVTCTFTVENKGTIDAKLSSFTLNNGTLSYEGTTGADTKTADETLVNGKIVYTLTYNNDTDYSSKTPETNDTLASGVTRPLKLTMTYPSSETSMPAADVTVSGFESAFVYVQN